MSYFSAIDHELNELGIRQTKDKNLVCELADLIYNGKHSSITATTLMRDLGNKYGFHNVGLACQVMRAYYDKPKCRKPAQQTDTSPQQVAQTT